MKAENYKVGLTCGDLYITIVPDDDGRVFEIFHSAEHKRECADLGLTQLCRTMSLAFRCGISVEEVAKQHVGSRCASIGEGIGFGKEKKIFSCYDAIGKALLEFSESQEARDKILEDAFKRVTFGICPHCHSELESSGGSCFTCVGCKKYFTCL